MAAKKIEKIINDIIVPYSLNKKERAEIAQLESRFSYKILKECIDIGVSRYFEYDDSGVLKQNSVKAFLSKLGGIAYNKSLSPIDQEILHLKNKGKLKFTYWREEVADTILREYVDALSMFISESEVIEDLRGEAARLMNQSSNWSVWIAGMKRWISDVKNWRKDSNTIVEEGTVLPEGLYERVSSNIQSLCKQINASYENNLFDCAAVIMRRLLENLLVLSYQNAGIDYEIMDKSGCVYLPLDKIIKNAVQNKTLVLSSNSKRDLPFFKDLGNYSAHKIWYNCTKQDIHQHIFKYRVIVEELMYISGVNK